MTYWLTLLDLCAKISICFVVGEPIEVKQNSSPTDEEIIDLHSRYISALQKLFEDNKQAYGIEEVKHLKFV